MKIIIIDIIMIKHMIINTMIGLIITAFFSSV